MDFIRRPRVDRASQQFTRCAPGAVVRAHPLLMSRQRRSGKIAQPTPGPGG